MDDVTTQEIIEAVADARAKLYWELCMGADCERECVVQLATQFLFQACTILQQVYDGNADITKRHIVTLLYSDANE